MTRAEACPDAVVIGGGLAGITAAIELAETGCAVTLIESRPWLGGATFSFTRRGLTIDNGQHIFLRCCSAYRDLLSRLGVATLYTLQDRLDLTVLADGIKTETTAQARLRRSALPAPLHLAKALGTYQLLSVTERARVAVAAAALRFAGSHDGNDRSLASWLTDHRQPERVRSLLWDWLCATTVNAPPECADLDVAASAIRTAVLAGRDHADVGVPSVPFSRLHSAPAAALLGRLGVTIRLNTRASAVHADGVGRYLITAVGGSASADEPDLLPEQLRATGVVLAVPPSEAAVLAPAGLTGQAARWSLLRSSPVVSVHVIYASRVTDLPFAVVAGSPVRWIIDKSNAAGLDGGQYLAAALPAADQYVDMPAGRLREIVLPQLKRLFPAADEASVGDVFVTRERRATIQHEPGVLRLRASADAGLPGLAVAGAWTDTGWPDSMEGAVRSGRSAARKLLADLAARPDTGSDESSVPAGAAAPSAGGP